MGEESSHGFARCVTSENSGNESKAARFKVTFDLPQAARTSNSVDRLMNYQDRLLYSRDRQSSRQSHGDPVEFPSLLPMSNRLRLFYSCQVLHTVFI